MGMALNDTKNPAFIPATKRGEKKRPNSNSTNFFVSALLNRESQTSHNILKKRTNKKMAKLELDTAANHGLI